MLKENLNQVAKDLNKVIQCLDSLKEAYTQKNCTTQWKHMLDVVKSEKKE